ncbi:NAD(P)-binding protein [Dendrothele bispora CBS 962.96]|uniref:NAD(P)-binding protein n=1 Tax=Dendrothele bispora (strain CBS 962.96) TaxID=1314807 RepID=A0A4S8MCJ5_DENBC|nr:NAD(P)-binding protein [Dendrothele bispora CBS 962.96]
MASTVKPTRIALVTGAAQGIGKAIALRLAKDGLHVAINDLPSSQDKLLTTSDEIKAIGRESSVHFADISNEEQVKTMINEVVEKYGGLDVMVANAGVNFVKPFLETTVEQLERVFSINVKGTFLCYKYAGIQMVKQGRGGRIIGASSIAGKTGSYPNISIYSGSKFAIRGITQAAAGELGKHKITVNAYAPGTVITDMSIQFAERSAKENNVPVEDFHKAVAEQIPVKYAGVPDDIAGLVSYLASEEAHFVTGQSVSINGGSFCD